jgi:hypothetical protein
MTTEHPPDGPDVEQMIELLRDTFPDAVMARIEHAAFFSLDKTNWPNFATIVWGDDFDEGAPSNLAREGMYRVNVGVDRPTFQRMVGSQVDPDYAAMDRFMPHPAYAKQRWISIINPSHTTVSETLLPLIEAAHVRLAAQRARRQAADESAREPRS